MLAAWGRSWDLCWQFEPLLGLYGRSWASLEASIGDLGLHLGDTWGLCWRSWAALGHLLAVLGRSWGRCVQSWAAVGAHVGSLHPLSGPMLAVLDRSWGMCGRSGVEKCEERGYFENVFISQTGARSAAWGAVFSSPWCLCWRSWAALGAYVGGLGASWASFGDCTGLPKPSFWAPKTATKYNRSMKSNKAPTNRLPDQSPDHPPDHPQLGLMLAVWGRSWDLCWQF